MSKLLDENQTRIKSDVTLLSRDLDEATDKLRIMTQKFGTARKERDQAKTDVKELQQEVLLL